MSTINITSARDNLFNLVNSVNDSSVPITIVNKKGKNAVLISEDDWNGLNETLYLLSIPGYLDSINNSRKEDPSKMKVYNKDEFWESL